MFSNQVGLLLSGMISHIDRLQGEDLQIPRDQYIENFPTLHYCTFIEWFWILLEGCAKKKMLEN